MIVLQIATVIEKLHAAGIHCYRDGEQLKLRADKGILSAELIELAQAHKAELLQWLNAQHTPLSLQQLRLWLDCQQHPRLQYAMPLAVKITGPVQTEKLQQAFSAIIQRHRLLRCSIKEIQGTAVHCINQLPELLLSESELQLDDEHMVSQWVKHWREKPLDINEGPLLRAELVKCGNNAFLLLLNIHHVLSDGISNDILLNELLSIYQGNTLPAVCTPDYLDYVLWQKNELKHGVLAKQRQLWQEWLSDCEPLQLYRIADGQKEKQATARLATVMPTDIAGQFQAAAKQLKITPFALLLSAVQLVLYKLTQNHQFCVVSPVANRQQIQWMNCIGLFSNALPIPCTIQSGDDIASAAIRMHHALQLCNANSELPAEAIGDVISNLHNLLEVSFTKQRKNR
jgi:hypothetical protein